MGNKKAHLNKRRTNMNEDILKGKWKESKGDQREVGQTHR